MPTYTYNHKRAHARTRKRFLLIQILPDWVQKKTDSLLFTYRHSARTGDRSFDAFRIKYRRLLIPNVVVPTTRSRRLSPDNGSLLLRIAITGTDHYDSIIAHPRPRMRAPLYASKRSTNDNKHVTLHPDGAMPGQNVIPWKWLLARIARVEFTPFRNDRPVALMAEVTWNRE